MRNRTELDLWAKHVSQVLQEYLVIHRCTQCGFSRAVLHTPNPSHSSEEASRRCMLELSVELRVRVEK